MGTFIYVNDTLIPVDLTFEELARLFEEGVFKPLEAVREALGRLGEAKSVKFNGSYLNIASGMAVIEYILEVEEGEIGVKLVYAEDPVKALAEYYEAERG